MKMKKRIAIVGAGVCGLTSTKACLEQNFEPVVFEKTNYTGGLWRYQNELKENGIGSVMKSTIINTSKEMSAFSDFPPSKELPNYMHNTKMVNYFDNYGNSFGFTKYVRLNHQVLSIEMADDFDITGKWKVTYRCLDNGQESMEIFDGVMICIGHHGTFHMPTFVDQDKFKGTIMHTHSLKSAQGFEDKVVVVIGIGNSAGDAAIELCSVTKQLYLSTRRGSWITKRVGSKGMPFDSIFQRRYIMLFSKYLPFSWRCNFFEKNCNLFFDHEVYQIKPKHRFLSQHVMVNDFFPNCILSGKIIIKSDIDRFTEDGIIFKGETEVTKCDVVIVATGYEITFPFISKEILPVANNEVKLYKFQFIPHLKHPHTMAFIGLIQPLGAIFPIAELQARWFAQLMLGNKKLPSRKAMEIDIENRLMLIKKRFYVSPRHTIQVDWMPFMEELAKEVGVIPPIWQYLFTDPKLFWTLMFKPFAAYQFRLVGPNSWKGARDAQINTEKRIRAALNTNKVIAQQQMIKNDHSSLRFSIMFIVFILILGYFLKFIF